MSRPVYIPETTKNFRLVLSLSLKFCIQEQKIDRDFEDTIKRVRHDIRTKYYMRHKIQDEEFNPKIYIRSN